jgi:hypothetical protein
MKKLLRFICLLAPSVVFGGTVGPVTISGNQVQIISTAPPTPTYIAYVYVPISDGGCTATNAVVLLMDSTNLVANAMYATILAAKTTGASVTITTSGCSSAGIPIINSIYLN